MRFQDELKLGFYFQGAAITLDSITLYCWGLISVQHVMQTDINTSEHQVTHQVKLPLKKNTGGLRELEISITGANTDFRHLDWNAQEWVSPCRLCSAPWRLWRLIYTHSQNWVIDVPCRVHKETQRPQTATCHPSEKGEHSNSQSYAQPNYPKICKRSSLPFRRNNCYFWNGMIYIFWRRMEMEWKKKLISGGYTECIHHFLLLNGHLRIKLVP